MIKGGIFYGGYAFYVIRGISYIYKACDHDDGVVIGGLLCTSDAADE